MKAKHTLLTLILSLFLIHINSSNATEIVPAADQEVAPDNKNAFDTRNDELTALLNWAAHLSGYKTNGINPQLQFRPHQFFVDNACQGNSKCRVVGWYNDQGIVYIDDRLATLESRFARSLVVHEFVHYLQQISGNFNAGTCDAFVQREREAYATQREFIMVYGVAPTMTFHQHSCAIEELSQKKQMAAHQAIR